MIFSTENKGKIKRSQKGKPQTVMNCIVGVLVGVLTSSGVDGGF
jgi:capsular polysaccharide biosynthesis protein